MLKFKLQNKKTNKILAGFQATCLKGIHLALDGELRKFDAYGKWEPVNNKYNLLQHIGIKDIHNREIYGGHGCNGDYVRITIPYYREDTVLEGFVKYSTNLAAFVVIDEQEGEILLQFKSSYYEIIDNPEEGKNETP